MATLIAIAIAAAASAQGAAQGAAPQAPKGQAQDPAQQVTVTGKLEWIDGTIGLRSGGAVYYAPQVRMLVGFVKDLQEGATVSLTGYAKKVPYSSNSFIWIEKLSFGGKDYELRQGFGPMMGRGMMGPGMMGPAARGRMQGPCYGDYDGDGVRERPRGGRW
jgi:hypothetical protein